MKTDDFDFELDESLIAQHPLKDRDHARLLVMDKTTGEVCHKMFYDIVDYLEDGDVLVLNDTKVIPARLYGHRDGKEEKVEVLMLKNTKDDIWECLVKPGKKMRVGSKLIFGDGRLSCEVLDVIEDGVRIIEFFYDGIFEERLDELGEMPLPPYITEKLENKDDYQTVYAKYDGSAAAPTAGLHFTEELLDKIRNMGVYVEFVTLHVGLGTFRPVKVNDIEKHIMYKEVYSLSRETADVINRQKKLGKIVAVGTTVVRTLESAIRGEDELTPKSESTDIFIYPGFEFKVVTSLITNFHLPKSTLMMLVSAMSTRENILNAYSEAIKEKYRFFSFGDAMFIKE